MPRHHHHGPQPVSFHETPGGHRHDTAKFVKGPGGQKGWFQDGRRLRHVKAKKAFVWPKDGKNGSKWGRMKDIFNNKGPDIYVAFGARKGDCVENRPTRAQWTRHTQFAQFQDAPQSLNPAKHAFWTHNSSLGGRMSGLKYDFRRREYALPSVRMWTDAYWQAEPYKNRKQNMYPEHWRDFSGRWWQDLQYMHPRDGGDVDNEFGDGAWYEWWSGHPRLWM